MESKCLLTKLRGTADNIPYFNKLGFKVPITSELKSICSFRQVEGGNVLITSDVVTEIYGSSGSLIGALPWKTQTNLGVYVKNIETECVLYLENLENVTRILSEVSFEDNFNLSLFAGCAINLAEFSYKGEFPYDIDLKEFSQIPNLTDLTLTSKANVYGDIRELAESFFENGRRSGTIHLSLPIDDVINSYTGKKETTLSFTQSGWTEI